MRAAYHDPDALAAEATLEDLARQLHKSHPGAAGSLREGLSETLTITRLGVPPTLARTLRSTNAVVIWSRPKGVFHVVEGPLHRFGRRAGRAYLLPSGTRVPGRFGVRSAGSAA